LCTHLNPVENSRVICTFSFVGMRNFHTERTGKSRMTKSEMIWKNPIEMRRAL
jgi:hypothetical protein